MTFFIQNVINALSLGSLYALVALGISLIFGIMKLINFAYGELIMAGGYTMALLTFESDVVPWPAVMVITLMVSALIAVLMERIAFRPVRGAPATTLLITSFALSYGLQNLARVILPGNGNTEPIIFPTFVNQTFGIGSIQVGKIDVITIVTTLLLLALLALFLIRAQLGLEMRAAAENFLMARMLGVRANVVISSAFAISGALAGVVSIFYLAKSGGVLPTSGLSPLLVGLVATVSGGMGTLIGAALGGYLLGFVTIMLQAYLPLNVANFRDALLFAIVIGILLLRPQGVFVGRADVARV